MPVGTGSDFDCPFGVPWQHKAQGAGRPCQAHDQERMKQFAERNAAMLVKREIVAKRLPVCEACERFPAKDKPREQICELFRGAACSSCAVKAIIAEADEECPLGRW